MQVDEKRWWAYDGAEVCELVGSFSLDKISVEYDKYSIGLYHNNGLSVFKNSTLKNRKELTKTFKVFGLEIAVESDLKNCKLSGRDTKP